MRLDKKLVTNIGLIIVAVAVVIGVQAFRGTGTVQAKGAHQFICHACGSGGANDPQQYICLDPSVNAVQDNANGGHLNEDSSHGPDHAPDIMVDDCSECPGAPAPSPSPSPTPSPSPSPSPA